VRLRDGETERERGSDGETGGWSEGVRERGNLWKDRLCLPCIEHIDRWRRSLILVESENQFNQQFFKLLINVSNGYCR